MQHVIQSVIRRVVDGPGGGPRGHRRLSLALVAVLASAASLVVGVHQQRPGVRRAVRPRLRPRPSQAGVPAADAPESPEASSGSHTAEWLDRQARVGYPRMPSLSPDGALRGVSPWAGGTSGPWRAMARSPLG
ncbi:MAG: hypothetical protein KatS3mg103_0968 [Phycisphaerales bacterium]|nr:MAG: hypothetical protein KatS3mg103_0968 [Phycisphaerales bacterium]